MYLCRQKRLYNRRFLQMCSHYLVDPEYRFYTGFRQEGRVNKSVVTAVLPQTVQEP